MDAYGYLFTTQNFALLTGDGYVPYKAVKLYRIYFSLLARQLIRTDVHECLLMPSDFFEGISCHEAIGFFAAGKLWQELEKTVTHVVP